MAREWVQKYIQILWAQEGEPKILVNFVPEGDGWFYCDRHKYPDFDCRDLDCASLVRGLKVAGPEVVRPTRFERIVRDA